MIPRKRLDLRWPDVAAAVFHCLAPPRADEAERRLSRLWSGDATALPCLSVRSGFDALLGALALPAGSEVLVSAVTIRDMARILEAHGLVPVPIDLDMRRLEVPATNLAAKCTARTRAVLVAHLFGSRMPMQALADEAHRLGLLVFEDCAQAYAADGFRGHAASDAVMFSFGTIKTATALGGGILQVRDPALRERVRKRLGGWPRQRRRAYLRRVLKYAGLALLSQRPLYGGFVAACRLLGKDHDALIAASVRGFSGPGFFERLRTQPCAPLLAMMARRIGSCDAAALQHRIDRARRLASLLGGVERPGSAAHEHTHWVFPILHDDPRGLVEHLWAHGFDATQGASSMGVVAPAEGGEDAPAREAASVFERLVYLPFDTVGDECDLVRLAEAVGACSRVDAMPIGPTALGR